MHAATYRLLKPLGRRSGFLLALLGGELLFLSVRFDTASLSTGAHPWSQVAQYLPAALRIGLAAAAAFLLLLWPRRAAFGAPLPRTPSTRPWLPWLGLHLALFSAFYAQTLAVFTAAPPGAAPSVWTTVAWLALGAALLLAWLLALAPPGFWFGLVVRERRATLVALSAGLLAWGLGELAQSLWRPLAQGTFWLSKGLLGLFYDDVLYDRVDHILGTPHFLVRIAPECSGYEGIGLITVFLALYLWLFRGRLRFPQAWLLFPLGAAVIWLANTVRISALIALGTSYSSALALGGFHSQAGWIAFALVAVGLITLAGRVALFARLPAVGAQAALPRAVPALLVPFLVLLAATMGTAALSADVHWLYPLRPLFAALALWHYRRVYQSWDWRCSWPALLLGALAFAAWILLEPDPDNPSPLGAALERLPEVQRAAWLSFRVLGSALVVPLAEELAFRGYLLRRLAGAELGAPGAGRFTWPSFLLSSVAFGLLHQRWMAATLAGMVYAAALRLRGNLADAVAAHAVTNLLLALWVLATGHWALWH